MPNSETVAHVDTQTMLGQLKELFSDPTDTLFHELCDLLKNNLNAEHLCLWHWEKGDEPALLFSDPSLKSAVKRIEKNLVQQSDLLKRPQMYVAGQHHDNSLQPPPFVPPSANWVAIPFIHQKKVIGGVLGVLPPGRAAHAPPLNTFFNLFGRMAGEYLSQYRSQHLKAVPSAPPSHISSLVREGIALNKGFGHGPTYIHRQQQTQIKEKGKKSSQQELVAFQKAFKAMQKDIKQLVKVAQEQGNEENLDILEAFEMIAADDSWQTTAKEKIATGQTAIAATQRVFWDFAKKFRRSGDKRLQDRTPDLHDISARMVTHLSGRVITKPLKKPFVLIAKHLGPGELMGYAQYSLQGLILEEGLSTSHVSILAKNMSIPIITGVKNILPCTQNGDMILIDGYHGKVYIRPTPQIRKDYDERQAVFQKQEQSLLEIIHQPPIKKDGIRVSLNINGGMPEDLRALDDNHADGVGLYRTEVSFMTRKKWLMVDEQTALYQQVIDEAKGRPVTFRTLDIGADKPLPYISRTPEHNPMMGWRAIRMSLDRPGLLRQQIHAILRACENINARIMLPMVAEVSEFLAVRELLDLEIARAQRKESTLPFRIDLGVMLEIPALSWQLPALLPQVDFVSIGSNDLFQFFFASDRTNEDVASRYDTLSPAFLNFISHIVTHCEQHQVPVAVCGEMAGEPLEAMALIGLGVTRLSMNATSVNRVKFMLRHLNVSELEPLMKKLLQTSRRSVRQDLVSFGRESGIDFL